MPKLSFIQFRAALMPALVLVALGAWTKAAKAQVLTCMERPNVECLKLDGDYTGSIKYPAGGIQSGEGSMRIRDGNVTLKSGTVTLNGRLNAQRNKQSNRSYGTIRFQNKAQISLRPWQDECNRQRIKIINIGAETRENTFRFCNLSERECAGTPVSSCPRINLSPRVTTRKGTGRRQRRGGRGIH